MNTTMSKQIGVRGFPYGIFDPCTHTWMGWESLSAAAVAAAAAAVACLGGGRADAFPVNCTQQEGFAPNYKTCIRL